MRIWSNQHGVIQTKKSMIESLTIRPITKKEFRFLDTMLYHAIYVPPGQEKLPTDIIEHPDISRYTKNFGREGDFCLVAQIHDELVGAIWIRHFDETNKGYGFVDSGIPELSMALYEQFRNKGIGTILLKTMIQTLADKGCRQISLSVDIINYAYDFYKKTGFKDHKMVGDSMTMVFNIQ